MRVAYKDAKKAEGRGCKDIGGESLAALAFHLSSQDSYYAARVVGRLAEMLCSGDKLLEVLELNHILEQPK